MERKDSIGKLKCRLEALLKIKRKEWPKCSTEEGCIMQYVLGDKCPTNGYNKVGIPIVLAPALGLTTKEAVEIAKFYDRRWTQKLKDFIYGLKEEV